MRCYLIERASPSLQTRIALIATDEHTEYNAWWSRDMRKFLMAVFWVSNFGNLAQLLIMTLAGWLIFSGTYVFFDLSLEVFLTRIVPWLSWLKSILLAFPGDLGIWILSLPILILSPIKFMSGVLIGWWAYSTAKKMPIEPTQA